MVPVSLAELCYWIGVEVVGFSLEMALFRARFELSLKKNLREREGGFKEKGPLRMR